MDWSGLEWIGVGWSGLEWIGTQVTFNQSQTFFHISFILMISLVFIVLFYCFLLLFKY